MGYVVGGGAYNYAGYNNGTGAYTPETLQGAVLERTFPPSPTKKKIGNGFSAP